MDRKSAYREEADRDSYDLPPLRSSLNFGEFLRPAGSSGRPVKSNPLLDRRFSESSQTLTAEKRVSRLELDSEIRRQSSPTLNNTSMESIHFPHLSNEAKRENASSRLGVEKPAGTATRRSIGAGDWQARVCPQDIIAKMKESTSRPSMVRKSFNAPAAKRQSAVAPRVFKPPSRPVATRASATQGRRPVAARLNAVRGPPPQVRRAQEKPTPTPPQLPLETTRAVSTPTESEHRGMVTVRGRVYHCRELLGSGGSSQVFRVVDEDGNHYAFKRVLLDHTSPDVVAEFKGEVDLLKRLHEESRVVRLFNDEITDRALFMVMELGDMDLRQIIAARSSEPLDASFVRYWATEVLRCVAAVHKHDIVHSDLKPANFLAVKGRLKLIDFGIANVVPEYTVNIHREAQMGTLSYMAPETLYEHSGRTGLGGTYRAGKPSDIWSCGCIIYEMVYGQTPFKCFGRKQFDAICDNSLAIPFPRQDKHGVQVPITLLELARGCLHRDPNTRLTLEDAMGSLFLTPRSVDHQFIEDLVIKSIKYGQQYGGLADKQSLHDLIENVWQTIININDAK